jgi:hypothetical protein
MQWLVDRIGSEKLQAVEVLTPTNQHFPEDYHGTDDDIARIFNQICERMGVPRMSVEMSLFDGSHDSYDTGDRTSALGAYERRNATTGCQTVWIDRSQAADPMRLVATVAHELAHCILLGDDLLTDHDADHEFITDLVPVVRGLGIFPANATLSEQTRGSPLVSWWSMSRSGYLPSRMFGYALAVFAWMRGEERPEWALHLRGDARGVMHRGLKFLQKTGDCRSQPPGSRDRSHPARLVDRLSSAIPGVFLTAVWELRRPSVPQLSGEEWNALVAGLDRRDPILVCETALAIAALERADSNVVERCLKLLPRAWGNSGLQSALARALGPQRDGLDAVIDQLASLLENESPRVVQAALASLTTIGPAAEPVVLQPMLRALRQGLVSCNNELLAQAAGALLATCNSPQKCTAEFFADDPELKIRAHEALADGSHGCAAFTARLPTDASLPVPLPDWRPIPRQVATQPHPFIRHVVSAIGSELRVQ